jgi:hypothetical protein
VGPKKRFAANADSTAFNFDTAFAKNLPA